MQKCELGILLGRKNIRPGESIRNLFSSTYYQNKILTIYYTNFLAQIIDFDTGILTSQRESSSSYYIIKNKLPSDLSSYTNASQ